MKILILLALLALSLPVNAQTTCNASDIPTLNACVQQSNVIVEIQNNIIANGTGCPVIMPIINRSNVTIDGNGYTILRQTQQASCSMVDIVNSNDINFIDITLDDDASVASCPVGGCARMIHIRSGSSTVTFDRSRILNGKGYVIYVNGGSDFKFINSQIINSGIIGLYIGGGVTGALVYNSVVTDTEVNGIAVLDASDVLIQDSFFTNNHRNGKFATAPGFPPGVTGGGQVYLARGDNITFCKNVVVDGGQTCPTNCLGGVHGVEVSEPNSASITNTEVSDNIVQNHTGSDIYINTGATFDAATDVSNGSDTSCLTTPRDARIYKIDETLEINGL